MKLAFCLFKYFPFGGLQRDFRAVVEACIQSGHEVDIYTMEWTGEILPHVTIHLVPVKGIANHKRYWSFSNYIQSKVSGRYDAVIGFNMMAGLDVYFAADACYQQRMQTTKTFLHRLSSRHRYFSKLEAAVFSPCSNTSILALAQRQINDFYYHYNTPLERFYLLPPWLNPDRFPPDNVDEIRQTYRQQWGIGDNDKLILMVGSGFKTKGLDRALIAIAALPEPLKKQVKMFVIGHDKQKFFLQQVKKLQVTEQVKFLGGRTDVPQFMFAADLLLHPAHVENTGNVLFEAMVAGLAIIATDVCGFAPYIVKANAGMVLPSPFKQENLNSSLQTMLQADFRAYGNNGIKLTSTMSFDAMPQLATKFIEKTATKKQMQTPLDNIKHSSHFFIYPELLSLFSIETSAVMQQDTRISERVSVLGQSQDYNHYFSKIMRLSGELYRNIEGRKTLLFEHDNHQYFAKLHFGIGWKKLLNYLIQFRFPVTSAKNEYIAIKAVERLQINTVQAVGFGSRGLSPVDKQSFLLTRAILNCISLEEMILQHDLNIDYKLKRQLINEVAKIAKKLHENGLNHRDFYAAHFLFDQTFYDDTQKVRLYLLDLHRAQIRKSVPFRWMVKDIASLYYSVSHPKMTRRDLCYFMMKYTGKRLKDTLQQDKKFWNNVAQKAAQLNLRIPQNK